MAQQPWIGCCLKHCSIFSSGRHFVQQKVTNLAILVKVMQKTFVRNFENTPWAKEDMSFKGVFSILSSDGHFVQQSRTIFIILVKGHPRNISVKSF